MGHLLRVTWRYLTTVTCPPQTLCSLQSFMWGLLGMATVPVPWEEQMVGLDSCASSRRILAAGEGSHPGARTAAHLSQMQAL